MVYTIDIVPPGSYCLLLRNIFLHLKIVPGYKSCDEVEDHKPLLMQQVLI